MWQNRETLGKHTHATVVSVWKHVSSFCQAFSVFFRYPYHLHPVVGTSHQTFKVAVQLCIQKAFHIKN